LVTAEQFIEKYPRLYHVATADALSQIKRFGLLSSEAMLELLDIVGEQKEHLLARRRPANVVLEHPRHGKFVLRDQIPMRDSALVKCLRGMEIPDWYRCLNARTFMWASSERVERLLGARAYRKDEHLVLTIDSTKLLADHNADVELSSINSGATLYIPPMRGKNTFCSLDDYEKFNGIRPVVEVTVMHSVPKLRDYIIDSSVRKAGP
jgi:hypothetical protein